MLKQKALALLAYQQRKQRSLVENQFCSYSGRLCMQNKVENAEFCARHILEDKSAPYKQCLYMSMRTSRRCTNIAKVDKKDGYCVEHARKSILVRPRLQRRNGPRATPESILEDLERHQDEQSKDADGLGKAGAKPLGLQDFLSDEESEDETRLVERTLKVDVESDDDSIDGEQEDLLKYAGVYTAEEVASVTREKLIRLQSLYIDQFKRLQYVLHEKRRKYLHSARPERELVGVNMSKSDPAQRQYYEKLMALKRYHKSHGVEAILHRRSKARRLAQTDGTRQKAEKQTCSHGIHDERCTRKALPLSKYCSQHILEDGNQVLFVACNFGEGACRRAVASVPSADVGDGSRRSLCPLHRALLETADKLPVENELTDEEGLDLDSSEEQTLATLAESLGDDLQTTKFSSMNSDHHMDESQLDESLLCLDPDGVPTLEEAMLDTGLETNSDELVMMLS